MTQQNQTALQRVENYPTSLAGRQNYGEEHVDQLRALFPAVLAKAPLPLVMACLTFTNRLGLCPFRKQVHFMQQGGQVHLLIGIDGYLALAERTGQYGGPAGKAKFCGKDKQWTDLWLDDTAPAACEWGVRRTTFAEPTVVVQTFREANKNTPIWKSMPVRMLMKATLAYAIRLAFPEVDKQIQAIADQVAGQAGQAINTVYGEPEAAGDEAYDSEAYDAEYEEVSTTANPPENQESSAPVTPHAVLAAAKGLWGKDYGEPLKAALATWNEEARDLGVDLIATEKDGKASLTASTPEQLAGILARIEHLTASSGPAQGAA